MRRTLFAILLGLSLFACRRNPAAREGTANREMPSGSAVARGPLLSYADVVDQIAPAVVTIRSSKRVRAPRQFPFFNDPLFREFFGGAVPRERGETQHALGSGVVVRPDGYILTNHHVVDGAEDIKVEFNTQRAYTAKLVGSDPPSDLAVLKINANGLAVLHPTDSDKVRVGDVCLAVGNPFGVGESVTAGIVSAKGRSTDNIGAGSFQDFLQTDAPINQGNSGGALVNTRGELIGINSQIISASGGNVGIGFAIPSNMAKKVMDQLIDKGSVQRGVLGIGIQPVTSDIASSLGLQDTGGVLINSVTPGGPAEKAGIQRGDVILQLNGNNIADANDFRNRISSMSPGTDVNLTVWRNGNRQQMKVKLGTLTAEAAPTPEHGDNQTGAAKLGISVQPLTAQIAGQLGIPADTQGLVIVSVDGMSPAEQAGLREGDVIQEVNRQPVRSPADLRNGLQKAGNRAPMLLINRGGQTMYVSVPLQ